MNSDFIRPRARWNDSCEVTVSDSDIVLQRGAAWKWQLSVFAAFVLIELTLSSLVGDFFAWVTSRIEILLFLGGLACWRWGWFALQSARAIIYRYIVYPRLRKQAKDAIVNSGSVPELTILAVTYKEKRWITQVVFESVFRELRSVKGLIRRPKLVVSTGCDDDDKAIREIYAECCSDSHGELWPPELVLLRGDSGKRPAIADALRAIVASNPHPEGVVMFMDGDTMLQPGMFDRTLPMFRLKPDVSAVTTNEDGWAKGAKWFSEWISLRFGLRHRTMCSIALSGKLLCLTGRMSIFRGSVASDPTFLEQIEKDTIQHWLWDSFDMLSGDDKSTWYWLAARGRRMLYVPDALVTTLEVVAGSAVDRALANVRRWSGNSLRHSWRAFKLGPKKLGLFCWYSLLDQRCAMWTVLVGPLFALIALAAGHWRITAGYLQWVLLSRIAHSAISWWHGRRISVLYLPLQILSDWTIALTKIWVLFHPAKQAWMNRGARTLDTTKAASTYRAKTLMAHTLYGASCATAVIAIGIFSGFLTVVRDSKLLLQDSPSGAVSADNEPARPRLTRASGTVVFGDGPASEEPVAISRGGVDRKMASYHPQHPETKPTYE